MLDTFSYEKPNKKMRVNGQIFHSGENSENYNPP